MDIVIQLEQVIEAVKLLVRGKGEVDLGRGVSVQIHSGGGDLTLLYNRNPVFKLSVVTKGRMLALDRAETYAKQDTGWGTLGMLLALRFGLELGCTNVCLASGIDPKANTVGLSEKESNEVRRNAEAAAVRFWQGIPTAQEGSCLALGQPIQKAIVTTMLKLNRFGTEYGNLQQTPPRASRFALPNDPPRRGRGGRTCVAVIKTINSSQ